MREITEPSDLIAIAALHQTTLQEDEAEIILGLFEGHDYCLMADENGDILRHDLQMENDHREDDPYSIMDVVEFSLEACLSLISEEQSLAKGDEAILEELYRCEDVLSALLEREMGGI